MPRYVYLCGFDTDCCVLATAIQLFELGICPVVLSYYCHSNGGEAAHVEALTCLNRLIGMQHVIHSPIIKCLDFNSPTRTAIFYTLAMTGMRRGEAMGLYWSDINFADKTISITKTRDRHGVRDPKTKQSVCKVHINDVLAPIHLLRKKPKPVIY